ncbi:M56 family metallopeptidase [Bryobacter aggregatus]|uniref:M56 family metallopeptidase n=1 Tax=Bryobacter aggregatus TaxID=360054 RepID=UPI0004E1BB8C|nr:M56 family metallopeptidase [Bryobacter aggregatus]
MSIFLEGFFNGWWQGIVLTLLVWLVLRDLPRVSAATKASIWQLTLLVVILLPLLQRIPLPVFEQAVPAASLARGAETPLPKLPIESVVRTPQVEVEEHESKLLLFAAVVLGFVQLLRLVCGYWMVRRLKRKSILTELELPVPLRRSVTVQLSDRVGMPMALGYRHPVILIPRAMMAGLSAEELRLVLLHECVHLLRRDDWMALGERILRAIFFFQPAVYFIGRQIEREREIACDDWVVAHTADTAPYAKSLARVAELGSGSGLPLLATGAGKPKEIFQRLETLLDRTRNRMPQVSGLLLLAAVLTLLFAVSQGTAFSRFFGSEYYSSRMLETNGNKRRVVKVRGEARYRADDQDVEWMSPGAKILMEQSDGWQTRKVELEPDADGRISRRYFVDGREHSWDGEAERYLAKVLQPWVREQGQNIPERVTRLLAQSGVSEAIDDIRTIGREDVKRAYLEELMLRSKPNELQLQKILKVARDMGSDSEKRRFLERTGFFDSGLEPQAMALVDSIHSNEDRQALLERVLMRGLRGDGALLRFLHSVELLESDDAKGNLLVYTASEAKGPLPGAYFDTAATVHSDAQRSRVLVASMRRREGVAANLGSILKLLRGLPSQETQAELLLELAITFRGDGKALDEIGEVARELHSTKEREEVLRGIAERRLTAAL